MKKPHNGWEHCSHVGNKRARQSWNKSFFVVALETGGTETEVANESQDEQEAMSIVLSLDITSRNKHTPTFTLIGVRNNATLRGIRDPGQDLN
jgi:hypothetical protein